MNGQHNKKEGILFRHLFFLCHTQLCFTATKTYGYEP